MLNIVKPFATALTALAFAATTISAQGSSATGDAKEIAAYRFTIESLNKIKKAVRLAAEAEAKSPQVQTQIRLRAAIDSLNKKDELSQAEQARLEKLQEQLEKAEQEDDMDLSDDETLSQMAKRISEHKPVADALRQVGMTPREFAVWTMAYLEAAMAVGLKQQGMQKDIPKGVNLGNVKFIEDHMVELKALQEEYERISKKRP